MNAVQTSKSTPAITVGWTRQWAWMNTIINREDIYERTRRDGCPARNAVSLQSACADPRHLFLRVDRDGVAAGFFWFIPCGQGVYEVHTNLLPNCRGRDAVRAGELGRDAMFLQTDCRRLVSVCPEWLPESWVFARAVGFKVDWERPVYCRRDGVNQSARFVSLAINEWVRLAHAQYQSQGEQFHAWLESHIGEESHPEDANHDGMVGLAWAMASAGQPFKAECVYNDWAGVAGYAPLKVMGEQDGMWWVNIGTAVIGLHRNGSLEFIRKASECQQ